MDDFKQHGAQALARLVNEVLVDPTQRKAFRQDPHGKASELGIDVSAMPERVLALLGELSGSELRLLSDLNRELVDGGLKVDVGDDGDVVAAMAGTSSARTLGVF